ncbi:hypothetical protein [Phyllobacterium lublinensis]|uniref:hypothetical protein n=1 Tax=Phyllobacterium lublinensis TaxID=2875708 RepID=UPI001CCD3B1B|nr:hypothetical protein [Phyllobacterium sp. 2063]MBZ9653520.1 hypothetical protein [Phyllobacterium sp. 2063]
MSDADLAANLLDDVIGSRGVREPVKSMLDRAYRALNKCNDEWTRRRVRSIFNKETTRIDHREIEEMRAVIRARETHAAFKSETAAIAAMAVNSASSENRGETAR